MLYYLIFVFTFFFSFVFWETQILMPFKHLAVFIHELWHSMMAMVFQMDQIHFHISTDESGKTLLRGNYSFLSIIFIGLAGYLGTMLTGSFFLNRLLKNQWDDLYFFLFISILFFSSFIFVNLHSFTFLVGIGWSIFLIFIYFLHKRVLNNLLIVLFSFFIFYSFFDFFDFSKPDHDLLIISKYLKNHSFLVNEKLSSYFLSLLVILLEMIIFYFYIIRLIFEDMKHENLQESKKTSVVEEEHILQNQNMDSKPQLENLEDVKKL